ncbi:hypothetical protein L596_016858 [Steinernema carpocapsae]|uniref:Uncharacterized protein n=1 Tax=Steinernema carpocapsae TaxID=34508 RepID=A0A4V6A3Q6_STECR|nr:hypothetical protein L596_016858 [Steinernema carpocapsae]
MRGRDESKERDRREEGDKKDGITISRLCTVICGYDAKWSSLPCADCLDCFSSYYCFVRLASVKIEARNIPLGLPYLIQDHDLSDFLRKNPELVKTALTNLATANLNKECAHDVEYFLTALLGFASCLTSMNATCILKRPVIWMGLWEESLKVRAKDNPNYMVRYCWAQSSTPKMLVEFIGILTLMKPTSSLPNQRV